MYQSLSVISEDTIYKFVNKSYYLYVVVILLFKIHAMKNPMLQFIFDLDRKRIETVFPPPFSFLLFLSYFSFSSYCNLTSDILNIEVK